MPGAAVKTAVEAKVATWSSLGQCPLVATNAVAASPAAAFLEIEYPVANEDRLGLGPRPAFYRESGVISLIVNVRALSQITTALTWAGELRDLFRDTEFGGVVTFEAAPPPFDKNNRRGNFYAVPVDVPYEYDFVT
jgi:hypothetical protein